MKQIKLVDEKSLEMEETKKPIIKDDEVLIEVEVCGICGSDVHSYKGEHPFVSPPIVLGHEYTGIVKEVGNNVTRNINIGDRVTSELVINCGECYNCRHGRYQICKNGKHLGNVNKDGAMAEFVKMKSDKIHVLPDNMVPYEGAMVEPTAVGVHAIRRSNFKLGDTALVIGAGVIGNLTAQLLKKAGAQKVIIAEIVDERLKKAKDVGIKDVVNTKNIDLVKWIDENLEDEQLDVVFDCAGTKTTLNLAIEVARKGSQIILMGVPSENIPVNMAYVQDRELEIIGTLQYVREDFERAINFISDKSVDVKTLITDFYFFSNFQSAFDDVLDPKKIENGLIKAMLKINVE